MEILKTIIKINPNAQVVVRGDNINTCEIEWLNNTQPISKSEIETMIPVVEQEIKQAKLQEEQRKQSAISKLKAIGLTDEEITALIGI